MHLRRALLASLAPLAALLPAGGCGGGSGKTEITRFPRWNFQAYERVAVLPVRVADPRAADAAAQAGVELEHLLAGNGQFTVLSKSDLAAILQEQDLSRLADVTDPATVIPAGRIQTAQALIVPTLTTFDLKRERSERKVPRYAVDRSGRYLRDRYGRPVVAGYDVIEYFRHAATVGGAVRVIDTATSAVVFSYASQPIEKEEERRGAPPAETPEALAADAARELARDLYASVAPQRVRVKLKSDMLVVANGWYDGKYDEARKIDRDVDEFLIAVRDLPRECDRNPFRVVVADPRSRRDLFEREFIWSDSSRGRGQQFVVPVAPLRESGAVEFDVKLYSAADERPILTRSFQLVTSRERQ